METLGKRIERARNNKDLSQEALARELQVSRQMVSKWELDQASPKTSRLEKISKALDIPLSDLVYGVNGDLDGNENQSKEESPVAKTLKRRMVRTRIVITTCILVMFMITLYLAYSVYKLAILNNLSSKVAQYANLENYYCKVVSYDDNGLESTQEIWYKDGVYKIVDIVDNNNEKVRTTKILDLNQNKRYLFNDEEKTVVERNLLQTDGYENGMYMYTLFPSILEKEISNYNMIAFGLSKLSYYKEGDVMGLEVRNEIIYLEKDTYLPISRARIVSHNEKKRSEQIREYYDIDLNIVKEEDFDIPVDYTIIK